MPSRKLRHLAGSAAVVLAMGTGVAAFSAATPGLAATNCSVNMQTPHFSTGANGVISKATWKCTQFPSTIYLSLLSAAGFNLWLCTDKSPTRTETYLLNDGKCSILGTNGENFTINGTSGVTRTTPPGSGTGAHGNGWWVACAVWRSIGPTGGEGSLVTSFSAVWEGSG